MSQNLIKARRALSELFKTGVEIRIGGRYGLVGAVGKSRDGGFVNDDGTPDPARSDEIAFWVQPPSPLHRDQALRNANAARSRASIAARKDEQSEEYLAAFEFIGGMDDETLYEYMLVAQNDDRQQEAVREILAEEEWSDVLELQDSLRVFTEEGRPDDDPEVQLVYRRERELQIQVNTRMEELRDAARDVLKMRGPELARKQAMDHHIEILCSRAFMVEYERQMTYYSVRDPEDHGVLFFTSAKEMAEQPDEVLNLVQEALSTFIKDGSEAKNSPGAAAGSASSAPPSKPEISEPSTPEGSTE